MSFEDQVTETSVDSQTTETSEQTSSTETQETTEAQPKDELQYEKGVKLSEKLQKSPDLEDIVDLGKLPKFKWNGKTLTAKELQSMAMMQSDYTKKTQEISQTKKYYENLYYDLENVKKNPQLAAEFKRIYPKTFHSYLDYVMGSLTEAPMQTQSATAPQQQKPEEPKAPPVDPRIDEVYNYVQEQRLASAQEKVDALFDRLTTKYPDADEQKIIARVQTQIELAKREPDKYERFKDADIEKLFKQEQESFQKRLKEHLSKTLDEQRKANARGRGPAPGGAIPGSAPRLPKTIKEATELALSDPNFQ